MKRIISYLKFQIERKKYQKVMNQYYDACYELKRHQAIHNEKPSKLMEKVSILERKMNELKCGQVNGIQ